LPFGFDPDVDHHHNSWPVGAVGYAGPALGLCRGKHFGSPTSGDHETAGWFACESKCNYLR